MVEPRAPQPGTPPRSPTAGLALIAIPLLLVAVFCWLLWPAPRPSPRGPDADRLAGLESRLESERATRDALAARIGELESELSELRRIVGELARRMAHDEGDRVADAPAVEAEVEAPQGGSDAARGFDAEPLIDAGVDPREVERLQSIWEESQLERAELLNRALREGYFLDEQHKAELAELDAALRGQLEGEDYDLYLYATGQPNRVRASRVLSNTNASDAGLRTGDVILSYGDAPVYKPGDLVIAASKGRLGDSVSLEVERDGRRLTLRARRGPLGVLLEPTRSLPEVDR